MQMLQICTGSNYIPEETLSAADLGPAWMSVRETLVALYAQHCPGNRPLSWWLIEAPMPRQCLQGAHICLQRDAMIQAHKNGQWSYGVPGVYVGNCRQCWEECYESQCRFLRRNRLLLPAEEGSVPITLQACDAWAARQYPDDHPHPWGETSRALTWCATVLGRDDR